MKKILISILILCSAGLTVFSQTVKGKVSVDARQDLLSVLPSEVSYFLPHFEDATVFFTDGKASSGKVNICLVDNSVRFIHSTGDTLLLSSQDRVLRIQAADTLILKTEDYFVKQIAVYGKTSLAERRRLTLDAGEEKQGGYGALPPTSTALEGKLTSIDPSRQFEFKTDISYTLRKDYILTDGEKVYPASTSSFIKFFPEKKKEIRSYVKTHKTDFKNKASLAQLFMFCAEQQ